MNADTTWLLQLPIPSSERKPSSRLWFNLILDPWLFGPQSDVASWFSRQWHAIEPAIGSIEEVNQLCERVECLSELVGQDPFGEREKGRVDAIAISHEFTDHCHKETLLGFDTSTPVIATTKAARLISGWKHFDRVIETPSISGLGADWKITRIDGLPEWLGVGRVVNGDDAFYYHSAVVVTFRLGTRESPESVIYSPHGISPDSLSPICNSNPSIDVLAILHGLHDVSIDWGQQLNLGALNGVKVQKALNAKYWIGTHDEVKQGGGIVSWLLRRKVYTAADVLQAAKEEEQSSVLGRGEYLELDNGGSVCLM